jgi:hypothetical protein
MVINMPKKQKNLISMSVVVSAPRSDDFTTTVLVDAEAIAFGDDFKLSDVADVAKSAALDKITVKPSDGEAKRVSKAIKDYRKAQAAG